MRRAAGPVVAVVATALALAACGGPPGDAADSWAEPAERWADGFEEAADSGIPNLARFLAPTLVVDDRATGGRLRVGRDAVLTYLRTALVTQADRQRQGPPYVSDTGLLLPVTWNARPGVDLDPIWQDAVLLLEVSREGLQRQESATSVVSARAFEPDDDWEVLETLAQRYLATPQAGGLRLGTVPGLGGPAVYGVTDRAEPRPVLRRAVLLLESERSCPGHVAVVLTLDASGTAVTEQRYDRVDDARRCRPGSLPDQGWWSDLVVPDPRAHQRTGTVSVGESDVEIWSGTPELEALVQWGLDRFAMAGLRRPVPASVTFEVVDPGACGGASGLAEGEQLTEITLCFGVDEVCQTSRCPPFSERARRLVLHELAHTWLEQQLTAEERQSYADTVGLDWWAPGRPAAFKAMERAAETIAWGLHDDPGPVASGVDLDPAAVAGEFRLLTGRDPLPHD